MLKVHVLETEHVWQKILVHATMDLLGPHVRQELVMVLVIFLLMFALDKENAWLTILVLAMQVTLDSFVIQHRVLV